MIYKISPSKKEGGNPRYRYNGRLVSVSDVPEDILELLKNQPTVEVLEDKIDPVCIFCGSLARYSRFINLKTIPLCGQDYYDKSTGKIAQKLHELEGVVDE